MQSMAANRYPVLIACMLVTFVLGSVHAFSVFLVPLEQNLDLPRSQVSLIYSWALASITVSVLVGYRIYARLPAWSMVGLTCGGAACGLYLAATASDWWSLFIGYSLMFGLANGVGYGYSLQLAGRELPQIRGFAMGAVTASYALGSIVFAAIFAWRIEALGVQAALLALMMAVIVCGAAAALLLGASRSRFVEQPLPTGTSFPAGKVMQFWFAYLCSVFAGLMAIGHAAGIVLWKGLDTQQATLGAMMIGVGSALGGFLAGWMIDRWPVTRFLVGLPLLAAGAMLLIVAFDGGAGVIGLLAIVGFSYGSIIAVYPVAISDYFGEAGPQVYGQVFTAWGFAGLVAPWLAGLIFDWRGGYVPALIAAAAIASASAVAAALCRFERAV
jgi:OFA family oxalate/formate antiporter-like MFS transporter